MLLTLAIITFMQYNHWLFAGILTKLFDIASTCAFFLF